MHECGCLAVQTCEGPAWAEVSRHLPFLDHLLWHGWKSKIEDRAKLFESCGMVDALPRIPVCQVLGCLITTVLNVRIDSCNIKIRKHPVLLIMHHVFVQWNFRPLLKFHWCIVNFGLLLVLEPLPFSIPEGKGRNLYYIYNSNLLEK